MKRELVDPIVKAIDALILDELGAKDPGRYARVAKLCARASDILQMAAMRVKDVAVQDDGGIRICDADDINEGAVYNGANGGGVMTGPVEHYPLQVGAIAGLRAGLNGDMGDLFREILAVAERMNERRVVPTPMLAEPTTYEIQTLFDLRERLQAAGRDTKALDKKIDRALAKMEDDDAVVHPDVSRGHPAGEDRPRALPPDREQAHGAREDGAGLPLNAGGRDGLDGQGHVPRDGT